MPEILISAAYGVKRLLFWVFNEEKKKQKESIDFLKITFSPCVKEVSETKENLMIFDDNTKNLTVEPVTDQELLNVIFSPPINQTTQVKQPSTEKMNPIIKCSYCDRCKDCLKDLDKEGKKKKEKEALESNMAALNYLACFVLFTIIFNCNLAIWLSIKN